jgi:hypothetical protein
MRWRVLAVASLLVVVLTQGHVRGSVGIGVLQFDGNDRVTIPNSPLLNPSQITVECWVNFGRIADDWPTSGVRAQDFISKGGDRASGAFFLRQEHANSVPSYPFPNIVFALDDVNHRASAHAAIPIEADRWYHVAGTYDGETICVYLDGRLEGSNVIGPKSIGNSEPLMFGQQDVPGYAYHLAGYLEEVRIWNYARTEGQIEATMDVSLTGSEPGLMGYWDFNEPAGCQTVYDLTANGNHGYLGTSADPDTGDPTRINPIPEPSSLICWGLIGLTFVGIGRWRGRRRA